MKLKIDGNEFEAVKRVADCRSEWKISGSGIFPFTVSKLSAARWMLAEVVEQMGWGK